ncbi:cerebellin-1-like isoform X2 [Littorina saxatilis]|uniref:C1q domain-containing protein n=1 Tax=Littorina saxatilis TaxID=31220 RepID=A0AAN9C0K9_9CAEN
MMQPSHTVLSTFVMVVSSLLMSSAHSRLPDLAPKPQPYNAWVAGSNNCTCVRELTQLKKELQEESQQRQELKGALETYVSELYELRAMVRSLKNSTPPAEKYSSLAKALPAVSFNAKLSYNRELKPLDTVVFDTVITNNGEAYNAETGKFTAPVPGTYVFYATILSGYNTKVETAIIINDKEVARMYSGAHDAHGSGSNAAIVNLKNGDSVWVRLLYQGGNHVHGYYSTFSGAIMTEQQEQ